MSESSPSKENSAPETSQAKNDKGDSVENERYQVTADNSSSGKSTADETANETAQDNGTNSTEQNSQTTKVDKSDGEVVKNTAGENVQKVEEPVAVEPPPPLPEGKLI